MTLAGGFNPRSVELGQISPARRIGSGAQAWLTEQADRRARREWRSEVVEWAILLFVVMEVILDVAKLL